MKEIAIYIAALFFALGCTRTAQREEKSQESLSIQSANLFATITFIQENPSSAQFNEALDHYLYLSDSLDYTGVPLTGSLDIRVFDNDSVLLNGFIYEADSVKNQCYDYLTFKGHWENNERMRVGFHTPFVIDSLYYSRGLFDIALVGDSLPYQDIQNVVVQISEAISEYKNFLGNDWFGKRPNRLSESEVNLIDSLVGVRIQICHFQEEYR